jgi:mannose-6-phosphate isomerase-like protein (cupin superfamily)
MAKAKVKTEEVLNREERPWGWFETIQEGEKYKVKRLFIKQGCRISLQSHEQRDEHWVVISGFGRVELEDLERHIGAGGHIFVPKKQKHRITAAKDMLIIEVQMGVCDEKDIRRYEDDYGRV